MRRHVLFSAVAALSFISTPMLPSDVMPTPKPVCDVMAKIKEADPTFTSATLSAEKIRHAYIETRLGRTITLHDYVKTIALRVLDTEKCTTETVIVTKNYGTEPIKAKNGKTIQQPIALLRAPAGWNIAVQTRDNGISWNDWATWYTISEPSSHVVIGVRYPVVHNPPQNGVRVKIVTYVPPSDAILNDVFVAEARKYLSENTKQAYASLRALNVPSRAFPGSLVADLPNLVPMLGTIIERLTPNEHMDLTEFLFNPKRTIEYVLALIGANGDIFASHTCSPAGACGPKQFTRGTYIQMRKNYPSAKLPADNIAARRDPLVSTQAAILLVDDILHSLVGEFGKEILSDKYLPEYILAAYNTGTSRVINVIKVAKKTNAADWAEAKGKDCRKPTYRQCLLPETKGYIAKDRFFNTVPWSGEQLTKAN